MANASFGDGARDKLRTAVAAVERDMSALPPAGGADPSHGLRASWDELVKVLALGPAPETRQCPVCSGVGMRAASRCAFCWSKLEPLADLSHDVPRSQAS